MNIASLDFTDLRIPFHESFRHASAQRNETETVWVRARSEQGVLGFGESCPRHYVTGESLDTAHRFFDSQRPAVLAGIHDLDTMTAFVQKSRQSIDASPAAWCAVELAVLDLMARQSGQSVECLLKQPRPLGVFHYTAVLGDSAPAAFASVLHRYTEFGFRDFKVKLSGDLKRDQAKITALRPLISAGARFRFDANNLWQDKFEARDFLRTLDCDFFAIEEPLAANRHDELAWMSAELRVPIILDESLLRVQQIHQLPGEARNWIVNLRVSKNGGLLRSLDMVNAARSRGMRVIVGAQVGETSLLTRAALCVAAAARDILVAQEGAFGTWLLTRDVCTTSVMFGKGGVLDPSDCFDVDAAGFGLDVIDPTNPN